MENTLITNTINNLPNFIKNTHFDIHLDGWPATFAVISICTAIVAVYAINPNVQSAAFYDEKAA